MARGSVSRKSSSRPVPTKSDKSSTQEVVHEHDWTRFVPGTACGGKLSAEAVAARSKGATEACLHALKKSKTFGAWERGEDLGSPPVTPLFTHLKKVLFIVVVVVISVCASIHREQSLATVDVPNAGDPFDITVTLNRPDTSDAANAANAANIAMGDNTVETIAEIVVDSHRALKPSVTADGGADLNPTVPPHSAQLRLQQRLEALQLEVKLEKSRAAKAKDKEDSMFSALEQSTQKVHELSRELRSSQNLIEVLEDKLKVSLRHSEAMRSVDRSLLALECLLVLSSIVGYVRAYQMRTAMVNARRSFVMAYRRQQRVLASADDVYAAAMRYSADVEASEVRPRDGASSEAERELNPWDPLLDDLDSLIKSNLSDRLDRMATPVQVLQALAAHFAELERTTGDLQGEVNETRRALELSANKMKILESEIDATKKAAAQGIQELQAESAKCKQLSTSLVSAQAKASGLEDEVRSATEQKVLLSEELLKAKEELEKVTAYASSLENSGFAHGSGVRAGVGTRHTATKSAAAAFVKDHLMEFSHTMDLSVGSRPSADENCGHAGSNGSEGTDVDDTLLGERVQRIKQLIQEANEIPFELLSPNPNLHDVTDAGTALRNLPVIGTLNISSSDSDEEDFNARQDASVQRMLDTSAMLSDQVAEYVEILIDDADAGVLNDLRIKRENVDAQRKHVEALVHASQKEARACRALKAKRKEVDFLSEKEEIMHGEDEREASDRLFYARKMENDAMLELKRGQVALRSALERARAEIRASDWIQ